MGDRALTDEQWERVEPLLPKGRNVVERSFNLAKQWRALATRYDKLAITYRWTR